jgi:hypothetical protein
LSSLLTLTLLTGHKDHEENIMTDSTNDRPEKILFQTHIAGMQFHPGKDIYQNLLPGKELYLVADPTNKYDKYATAVHVILKKEVTTVGYMLGYIPGQYSRIVSVLLSNNIPITCFIVAVDTTVSVKYTPITIAIALT